MLRKPVVIIIAICLVFSCNLSVDAGYIHVSEVLCNYGLELYQQGQYAEALQRFKMALMAQPGYEPALRYIQMMQEEGKAKEASSVRASEPVMPRSTALRQDIPELIQLQKEMIQQTGLKPVQVISHLPEVKKTPTPASIAKKPTSAAYKRTTAAKPTKVAQQSALYQPAASTKQATTVKQATTYKRATAVKPATVTKQSAVSGPRLATKQPVTAKQAMEEAMSQLAAPAKQTATVTQPAIIKQGQEPEIKVFTLDETFNSIQQPINIQKGETIVVEGKNISKFLVTPRDILNVEQVGGDRLLVTGKNIGYSYLHIWDDNGRWTSEWMGIFPVRKETLEEKLVRLVAERAGDFRLSYGLDWTSYETGKGIRALNRSSYAWSHHLGLRGPTPYGNMYSNMTLSTLRTRTDLTYFSLGVDSGRFMNFKDFDLRFFDSPAGFSNLAFPGATVRGATLSSPAFNKKIDYTIFYGRESGGEYGLLSPGLNEAEDSFLDGFNLNYSPFEKQTYSFSLTHGWGSDRREDLPSYTYDWQGAFDFQNGGLVYELASDTKKFANLLTTHYTKDNFSLTTELRDINRNFYNISSKGWRAGELGALVNINYKPLSRLQLYGSANLYRDRAYPATDDPKRWNEDLNVNLNYNFDPLTSLNLNQAFNNDLGKITQTRYYSTSLGLSRKFKLLFKDIYTFMNYSRQENKGYSSPSSSYINNRIYASLRFSLVGELYYYLSGERDYTEDVYQSSFSRPSSWETGLDWSQRLAHTPLYGAFRMTYHNEENAGSALSFMSGQDYIEGYSQLSYRPSSDKELYGSCRMRNVWADNPTVDKHFDMTFNAGMRYTWGTGVRWEAVCNIEGYIFQDANSDGLRQRDEPPVEGVTVWLGPDKSLVTDIFGYYQFKGVRGRKVHISLDTATIPVGYVLTVPAKQDVAIQHLRTSRIDFGIISHSEIFGYVFEDVNNNGEYDLKDKGLANVALTLDSGKTVVTDTNGKYVFQNISKGQHIVKLELKSLPVSYIPKVALSKEIPVFEGTTYFHNIPLRLSQE